MSSRLELIGDGIENPWNARTLIDAAAMFGSSCYFRDRKKLYDAFAGNWPGQAIQLISCEQMAMKFTPILALDNVDNALDLFGFKLNQNTNPAIIVGNEKFGIAHDMRSHAEHVLEIPMTGHNLNTLNVASAAGVALYYLTSGFGGRMHVRSSPQRLRPELMLIGGSDHFELGSAIRSAGAFGWDRMIVDDREKIWFGCNRITRSEGRAAARRGRNPIRLLPCDRKSGFTFKQVLVVSTKEGEPLHRAELARGPQQLIVIPDESQVDFRSEDWQRLGNKVQFVKIELPVAQFNYHYRLLASIALAEVSRQVGTKTMLRVARRSRQGPVYESAMAVLLGHHGEAVYLEDLSEF